MNGAQALIRTLADAGVDTCFANPGTSEMHFVAALDSVGEMRSVLGLFEGVVTGAADGYARMADRPAATLLHLGSGLGNGLANLHNARRAYSPMINIVGDHATYHARYDAPLQSDIDTVARNCSTWIARPKTAGAVARAGAEAVLAASTPPGGVATLVLPADASWGEGAEPAAPLPIPSARPIDDTIVDQVAKTLTSGERTVVLVGGSGHRDAGLRASNRLITATGATVLGETFPARLQRGAGVPALDRLQYLASSPPASSRGHATSFWPVPSRRPRSSPTPTRPATSCPPGARCTCSLNPDRTRWRHWRRWLIWSPPGPSRCRRPRRGPIGPAAISPPSAWRRPWGH